MLPNEGDEMQLAIIQPQLLQECLRERILPDDNAKPACSLGIECGDWKASLSQCRRHANRTGPPLLNQPGKEEGRCDLRVSRDRVMVAQKVLRRERCR